MNTHDEVLDQMSGANPLPDVEMITDGQLTEMTVQVEDALRTAHGISPLTLEPANPRITWWRPAAVFAAAVIAAFFVIGVVSLATGGDGDARPAATVPTIAAGPAEREWSDVLAVTQARSQPQVASCRTEPTVGPPMQEKPSHGWKGPLAGVFDSRRGSILYVDSLQETWAFDICNNKWSPLNPEGRPVELPSGGLVYDVDSDVT
ncbi:MAG: hypothetical protein QNJ75_08595, partial [Acidimicrobiia bacterium]|nr:hypothetical protein [Acidimicrobiia bacterium]